MSNNLELFKFAAKAGSLEGYLFKRRKVESLSNWTANILRMHGELPPAIKKEIQSELLVVLERILNYGSKTIPPDLREEINKLVIEIKSK